MQSLTRETKFAQQKADLVELNGYLERVQWMHARCSVLQERNAECRNMLSTLTRLESQIYAAMAEVRR